MKHNSATKKMGKVDLWNRSNVPLPRGKVAVEKKLICSGVTTVFLTMASVTLKIASRSSIFELDLDLHVVHQCCEYGD